MLTEGTRAQLSLSQKVAAQLDGKPLRDILDVMMLCLQQDSRWLEASRGALAGVEYNHNVSDHSVPKAQRAAFEAAARFQRFPEAVAALQEVVNAATDSRDKGWLKQQLADYMNRVDPVQAQQIMLSALSDNAFVLKPLKGISYARCKPSAATTQADGVIQYVRSKYSTPNEFVVATNSLLDDLKFCQGTFKQFEKAIDDLAFLLGFTGQRPDAEYGVGPDNLWALGDLQYLVIECKNEATAGQVAKNYANQLSGSMNWFRANYDKTCGATAIIVHPAREFAPGATPWEGTRVITGVQLEAFKTAVRNFVSAIAAPDVLNASDRVAGLLDRFALTRAALIPAFTVDYVLGK